MIERTPDDAIPDHRVPDILARAAEIDRVQKETSSVEALRQVALDAGISVTSLEEALEEYARETRQPEETTSEGPKDATVGTLLAALLGGFGAHRFYLGDNKVGLIYLIFFWTLIPSLLGIVEAFFMPGRVREYNARSELVEAVRMHRLAAVKAARREAARVPCPLCAEMILPDAKICRYCQSDLTGRG